MGASAGLFAAGGFLLAQSGDLTARQVIERIQKAAAVPWREKTVDTIKAGSPDTPIRGIATTMVATLDLLQRANAAHRNMIIVHEPTFYSSLEDEAHAPGNAEDPLFQLKKDFIEKNSMVVWRFHDHWHAQKPDGIIRGMGVSLGWEKYRTTPDNPMRYTIPSISLENLAKYVRDKLNVRTMRVIGDPQTMITRAAFNPGSTGLGQVQRYMWGPDVDVFICGEPREWDADEYARDSVTAGKKKGMIILGHDMSEEGGMEECARWLKTFITEVPVEFMSAGEAFWTPK